MKTTEMTDRERARRINRIVATLATAKARIDELDATVNTDDFKYFSARLNEIIGNDEEGLTYIATVYAASSSKR
jgi:hypothetical protein